MSVTHIVFAEIGWVAEDENELRLKPLLGKHNGNNDLSVTWVELQGRHRMLRSGGTSRLYQILSGTFMFEIREKSPIHASAGDQVLLAPYTVYGLQGSGEYLVINVPAFSPGDDEYIE